MEVAYVKKTEDSKDYQYIILAGGTADQFLVDGKSDPFGIRDDGMAAYIIEYGILLFIIQFYTDYFEAE